MAQARDSGGLGSKVVEDEETCLDWKLLRRGNQGLVVDRRTEESKMA